MNRSCVTLTFDDGWKSQLVNAIPTLDEFNIKATFYIITRYLYLNDTKYMNRGEVLQVYDKGHEVGAHTVTHPNLKMKFLWKGGQVLKSLDDLKSIGIQPTSFAYPYGKFNFWVKNLVKNAGFESARAVKHTYNDKKLNQWAICGKFILRKTSLSEVKNWLAEATAKGYWLVLIFHQVEANPGPFGCTPGFLHEICKLMSSDQITKLALSDALRYYYSPESFPD